MRPHPFLLAALLCAALLPGPAHLQAAPRRQPNFVFILADDLGCMDLRAYKPDSFYETPHLDRLAAEGARFTAAYAAAPVCSPTRASIFTGKYPARLRLTNFLKGMKPGKLVPPEYQDQLPLQEVTIAEALKKAGYTTGFFGKWHLGGAGYFPEAQGFDENVGGSQAGAPSSYFSPYKMSKIADGPPGEFLTERITTDALDFMRRNARRPFFIFLSHYAVHIPLQAKPEVIKKYEAKAAALPQPSEPKFLPEGENEARRVQDHPTYAAMIESLDDSVGRVLQKLDELKLAKDTVVIFFSDNGGLSTAEGAPTSNVPFRAGKGWLYEGGIREPLLVRWPGMARPGSVCESPVISTDFFPTLLEMAHEPLRPEQHCDGRSLVPLLKGLPEPAPRPLFWHYPHYSNQGGRPSCAVRLGDWKLIRAFEDNNEELYNLARDVGEHQNVLDQTPERAAELRPLLDQFLADTKAALPRPKPDSE